MLNGSTPVSDVPVLLGLCVSVMLRHHKLWSSSSAIMFTGVMPPHCATASPLICSPQTLSSGSHTTATVISIRALHRLLLFCCISVCVCVCVFVAVSVRTGMWIKVCASVYECTCIFFFFFLLSVVHVWMRTSVFRGNRRIPYETVVPRGCISVAHLSWTAVFQKTPPCQRNFPKKWSLMMFQDRWFQMSE